MSQTHDDVLGRGYVAIEDPQSDTVRQQGGCVRIAVQDEQSGASVSISAVDARSLGVALLLAAGYDVECLLAELNGPKSASEL